MDIWIIQNGEKTGPIHDFDVRKKIEHGELPATTPAWHDGLPAWKPLIEISLFEREFDRPIEVRDAPRAFPAEDPGRPVPPPLPDAPVLWRRFWARWFDLYLFAGVWWVGMWFAGRDIEGLLTNPWVMLFQYVPWFVLESLLLQHFATTPGKWLLGLKVVNDDGSLLSLASAIRRSARVLFIGLGFGWGPLSLVCQILAYFNAKYLGRPLWDHSGGHRVVVAPLKPLRIAACVLMFFVALQLQMIVVAPYVLDAAGKTFPALKEQFDKNPPWHLPKNS
jgi:uncharacterized RDD family membrane protein YckC